MEKEIKDKKVKKIEKSSLIGEILAKIIKVPNIIYKYLDLLRTLIFSQLFINTY